MARSVDFNKRIEKLKGSLDDLLVVILNEKEEKQEKDPKKIKVADLNWDEIDDLSLMQIQQKISQLLIMRVKSKEE